LRAARFQDKSRADYPTRADSATRSAPASSVLNAVILNPLPFPEPDRLVRMYNIYPGVGFTGRGMNSGPDYA